MKYLREFKIVILIAGLIVLLVLIKVFKKNDFSGITDTAIKASTSGSNLITPGQLKNENERIIILNLDQEMSDPDLKQFTVLNIQFEKLSEKGNLTKLKDAESKIVIQSDDASLSAKAWVMLDQMEIKNLFILNPDNNEVLKYKFQPDTTIRPE